MNYHDGRKVECCYFFFIIIWPSIWKANEWKKKSNTNIINFLLLFPLQNEMANITKIIVKQACKWSSAKNRRMCAAEHIQSEANEGLKSHDKSFSTRFDSIDYPLTTLNRTNYFFKKPWAQNKWFRIQRFFKIMQKNAAETLFTFKFKRGANSCREMNCMLKTKWTKW